MVAQEPEKVAQTCTAEQKEKVKELIAAYVKTGPGLASPTPQAPRRPQTGTARGGSRRSRGSGPGCCSCRAGQEVGTYSRGGSPG